MERLLDLPVLATASSNEDMARLAKSIRVLMGRSELSSLVVAGASAADGAKNVERALVGADEVSVTGLVDYFWRCGCGFSRARCRFRPAGHCGKRFQQQAA